MEDPDPEVERIKDPEEYVHSRRLEQIFDIREDIHETRQKLNAARHNQDASKWDLLCLYRTLVDSYIMETEPILRRYKPGPELLSERHYGTVTVKPNIKKKGGSGPSVARYELYQPESDRWVQISEPDIEARQIELVGLKSLLKLEDPITAEFEFKMQWRHGGPKPITRNVEAQVGFRMLDGMVRSINDFLASIGFAVTPEEQEDPAII